MSNDFLRQRHAAYRTSEATLGSLVKTSTGQALRRATAIAQGYANEVYRVETHAGDDLIVRIGHDEMTNFRAEAWAMVRAREAGVLVPHIYDITTIAVDDQPRPVMVMQAVQGRPLADVEADLTQDQRAYVFEQVGLVISKLHSVYTSGIGPLDADGRGAFPDWETYIQATLMQCAADVPFLIQAGLTEDEAHGLLRAVHDIRANTGTQAVLCHGDLSTDHLFVDAQLRLCGVIDWGQCRGGAPALDLAVLLMYHPEVDLAWLQRGYGEQAAFDATWQRQILAQQANVGINYLAHDTREGNTDAREIALQRMRAWLYQWQALQEM